jgi:hypothetical protein
MYVLVCARGAARNIRPESRSPSKSCLNLARLPPCQCSAVFSARLTDTEGSKGGRVGRRGLAGPWGLEVRGLRPGASLQWQGPKGLCWMRPCRGGLLWGGGPWELVDRSEQLS